MPMAAADIEAAIVGALPGASVEITDLAGDGDHYAAVRLVAAWAAFSMRSNSPRSRPEEASA